MWPTVDHSTTASNKATSSGKYMRLQRRLGSADVAELSTLMLGDAAILVKDVRSATPLLRLEGELANRVGLALSIARHSATVVVPNAGPIIITPSKDLDMQHQQLSPVRPQRTRSSLPRW